MSKIDNLKKKMDKAKEVVEIGEAISPVKPPIDPVKVIDAAEETLTLFQKIRGLFKKK